MNRPVVETPVVDTMHGPVRGTDDGTVMSFKGIRYAAPPVGELRFRAPAPPQPWTEPADADEFGSVCPQPPVPNFPINLGAAPGEECLTRSGWAPGWNCCLLPRRWPTAARKCAGLRCWPAIRNAVRR